MSSYVRLHQISTMADDGTWIDDGKFLSTVDGVWAAVDAPAGGGGGGGTGAFFDDYERPDAPLVGDNGWVATDPLQMADFYIEDGVVKQTGFGNAPVVHLRDGAVDVADVQVETTFDVGGGQGSTAYLWCCTDLDYATTGNGVLLYFDGGGFPEVRRWINGGEESPTAQTDLGWVTWDTGDTMVLRMVYTEATSLVEVYQNGVKTLTCDVSDANYGMGHELPALSTMLYAGYSSNGGDNHHTFNDFSVDQATSAPGGVALDDLTDVDTTTVLPADQQFLKFDLASGLWVPADLPSSTTGSPIDCTDTPEDPPPYAGYTYMTSDGKVRIWSGTEWRQIITTLYTPPSDTDPAIMLPSLIGRYRSTDLGYADGDPVAVWPDLSGLSNDLVTVAAGTMETTGIGGLPSVVFTDATLYQLPTAVPRPLTVLAVMQNNDTGVGSIIFSNAAGDGTSYAGLVLGGGWRVSDGSSTVVDYAATNITDPHIFFGRVSVAGMSAGADGGKATSGATVPLNVKNLGQWAPASAYSMSGLVSEMLIYNAVLTDAELDAIIHQLGLVYGIATSV